MTDPPASRVFVGRSTELGILGSLLENAAASRGSLAAIDGEPGIGKTRLLAEIADAASAAGFRTLRGRAHELEQRRPFGPLVETLLDSPPSDPLRATLKALLAEGPTDPGASQIVAPAPRLEFRITEGFLDLLENECARSPVLLTIDDLQWADPATVAVLHRVGRAAPELPLLVLVARRPLPTRREIQALLTSWREHGLVELELGPLDEKSTAELVSAAVGRDAAPALIEATKPAGGNPLFIEELLDAARRSRAGPIAPGRGRSLPASLRQSIFERLSFLPEPSLDLLRLGSILGTEFGLSDLAALAGKRAAAIVPLLNDALTARVVTEERDRLRFRHDLVREVLYEDLPRPARMALHREAAHVLAARDAPPQQIAEHLARGSEPGDRASIAALHDAARATTPQAPAAAAEILERALQLSTERTGTAEITADLALALAWSGRLEEAMERARQTLSRPVGPGVRHSLRIALYRAMSLAGRIPEALAAFQESLDDDGLTEQQRALVLAEASAIRAYAGDPAGARAGAEQALAFAVEHGDPVIRCVALSSLSFLAHLSGRNDNAVEFGEAAVRIAGEHDDKGLRLYQPHVWLGTALIDADRLDDAERILDEGRLLAKEAGLAWQMWFYHAQLGLAYFVAGRWEEAVAELEAGMLLGESIHALSAWLPGLLGVIAVHRDDLARAKELFEAADRATTTPTFGIDVGMWGRALLSEAQGDLENAAALMESAWRLDHGLALVSEACRLGPDTVRLCMRLGNRELGELVTGAMEEAARANPSSSWRGAALWCRGMLEGNLQVLLEALDAYRGSPRPLERALVMEETATAMIRAGERERGTSLLDDAVGLYEKLGAVRDLGRAEAVMQATGARRRRRARARRPRFGWSSLTPTEIHVARHVAEGLSNPQIAERMFLSRHTVQTHVSHILQKLGLSSRVELAAEAVRRERAGNSP